MNLISRFIAGTVRLAILLALAVATVVLVAYLRFSDALDGVIHPVVADLIVLAALFVALAVGRLFWRRRAPADA